MLHTKFQGQWSIGSGEEIFKVFTLYDHGGHVGFVTQLIYINFHFHSPSSCPMNFGSKSHNCFWGKQVLTLKSEWPLSRIKEWPWLWYTLNFINSFSSRSSVYWFWRRRFFKDFTKYGHGGHVCHVTKTARTFFRSPDPWRLHMKFGDNWPCSFRREVVWNCGRTTTDNGACQCYKLPPELSAQVS